MIIRPATVEDAPSIAALHAASWRGRSSVETDEWNPPGGGKPVPRFRMAWGEVRAHAKATRQLLNDPDAGSDLALREARRVFVLGKERGT